MRRALPVWEVWPEQELPDLALSWRSSDGQLIDLSASHTYQLRVAEAATRRVVLTKTSGFTGAATDPNLTIAWSAGELSVLAPGRRYLAQIRARRTSDNKDRLLDFAIHVNRVL